MVFKLLWRVEDFLKGQLGTGKVGEQAEHPTMSYMRVFVPNCISSTWHTEYLGCMNEPANPMPVSLF